MFLKSLGLSSLNDYFLVVAQLVNWFLYAPKHPSTKLGFNKENINTFLYQKIRIHNQNRLIKLIK